MSPRRSTIRRKRAGLPTTIRISGTTGWRGRRSSKGILFIFYDLAEVACLPRMLPAEQLPDALSLSQASENAATMLGPTLGGALYTIATGLPFLADAISYAASVLSLFL